jgi:hypothetical protein
MELVLSREARNQERCFDLEVVSEARLEKRLQKEHGNGKGGPGNHGTDSNYRTWPHKCSVSKGLSAFGALARETRALYIYIVCKSVQRSKLWTQISVGEKGTTKNGEAL